MDWNVLGHEWAAALLGRHVARGEMRHAYLLSGPQGVGRRTLALRFAQAVNCLQPPEPGQPCGTCLMCRRLEGMQQADLSLVMPDPEKGRILVEQVRELQRSLSLSPYEARYRIALLLSFEKANENAQNALLKTLEEAPPRVILLLTADSPESLLPTIVSRCEVLRLRPAGIERLEQSLQARWGVAAERARLLAHLSAGCPGTAVRLLADDSELKRRDQAILSLLKMLPASRRERLAFAESATEKKSREDVRALVRIWLLFWRDLFIVSCASRAPLIHAGHAGEMERLAGRLEPRAVQGWLQSVEQSLAWLDTNAGALLIMENLLLDLPRLAD